MRLKREPRFLLSYCSHRCCPHLCDQSWSSVSIFQSHGGGKEDVGALSFLGGTETLNCSHPSGHTPFARTLSDGPTQLQRRLGSVVSR